LPKNSGTGTSFTRYITASRRITWPGRGSDVTTPSRPPLTTRGVP
jgi:hypothetical protein